MTENAINKRREYRRKYYQENKEHIRERQNKWRKDNKDKIKKYNIEYWEKVASKTLQAN